MIIYVNVNEDGETYDEHDTVEAALAVQAQFPNDTIEVRQVDCNVLSHAAVIAAACAWVESITDHPNDWAGDEDRALITAIQQHTGKTYKWENT